MQTPTEMKQINPKRRKLMRLAPLGVAAALCGALPLAGSAAPAAGGPGPLLQPTLFSNFLAYGQGVTGGVRVAAGDVDGDGTPDIITGLGPYQGAAGPLVRGRFPGGPEVRVFSGGGDGLISDFYAYDFNFKGGVYVAAGDVNGDGRAEILTANGAGMQSQIREFKYDGFGEPLSAFNLLAGYQGETQIAVGDVTGDGKLDLIAEALPNGHPRLFGLASHQEDALFRKKAARLSGWVAAGDVNGDGRADVAVGSRPGQPSRVTVVDGATGKKLRTLKAMDKKFRGGVRVAAGDVNGDGRADVIVAAGPGGGPRVQVFSGADGRLIADFTAFDSTFRGGLYVTAGDFNGDGRAEIVVGAGEGNQPFVKVFTFAPLDNPV